MYYGVVNVSMDCVDLGDYVCFWSKLSVLCEICGYCVNN